MKQPTGVWTVTTEGNVASTNLERHLLYLLERLEPRRDAIADVRQRQSLEEDFFCYWVAATDNGGGPEISPSTLKRIATLGARLGIDFYRR